MPKAHTICLAPTCPQNVKRQLRSALAYPSALANGRISHLQRQLTAARKVLAAADQRVRWARARGHARTRSAHARVTREYHCLRAPALALARRPLLRLLDRRCGFWPQDDLTLRRMAVKDYHLGAQLDRLVFPSLHAEEEGEMSLPGLQLRPHPVDEVMHPVAPRTLSCSCPAGLSRRISLYGGH